MDTGGYENPGKESNNTKNSEEEKLYCCLRKIVNKQEDDMQEMHSTSRKDNEKIHTVIGLTAVAHGKSLLQARFSYLAFAGISRFIWGITPT